MLPPTVSLRGTCLAGRTDGAAQGVERHREWAGVNQDLTPGASQRRAIRAASVVLPYRGRRWRA